MFPNADYEFAWACGLFEGEGTCGSYRCGNVKKTKYLKIAVVMTDLDVLQRFQRAVGEMGMIYGPLGNKNGTKPIYGWQARGDTAEEILHKMYPFMNERRQNQIVKALTERGMVEV